MSRCRSSTDSRCGCSRLASTATRGACKWLRELELTTFATVDAYWVERGWPPRGPVKSASRIDTPAPFARLSPGRNAVAGVAWAQGPGITAVEVQVDDEPWQRAALLPVPSIDTW